MFIYYNMLFLWPFKEWNNVVWICPERKVERTDRRAGEPEDGHGDDVSDDQLWARSCGGLYGALHGDRHRHRGGQAYRYHLPHCLPRWVRPSSSSNDGVFDMRNQPLATPILELSVFFSSSTKWNPYTIYAFQN